MRKITGSSGLRNHLKPFYLHIFTLLSGSTQWSVIFFLKSTLFSSCQYNIELRKMIVSNLLKFYKLKIKSILRKKCFPHNVCTREGKCHTLHIHELDIHDQIIGPYDKVNKFKPQFQSHSKRVINKPLEE